MAQGMLSGIFGTPPIDRAAQEDDERLRALALGGPFKADAYTAYGGGGQAGRGIGKLLGGLTGHDVRAPAEKRSDAIEAAKAQVSQLGFNPEDPKAVDAFYKQVIQILQKQGLPGEALDVAREWSEHKKDTDKAALDRDRLAESTAKREAKKAADDERNVILKQRNVPELMRLIDVVESFDPITQAPQRKMRLDALNAKLESLKKGIVLEDAGDRIIVRNRADGAILGTDNKGAEPMNAKDDAKAKDKTRAQADAYASAAAKLQADYDAAVRLYNHQGLDHGPTGGIVGRAGRLVGESGFAGQSATTAASGPARAALDLWKQVVGATFLAGLNDLKASSPTGSTGLGQTSNIEGDKVQSAKAALSRNQDAPDFRLNLKIYVQSLEDQAARLRAAAAAGDGSIKPLAFTPRALTAPGTRARPAAPAAAPAAPAAASDTVKIKTPDGRTGNIPRANLEAAKAAGAVEVQ